MQKLDANRFYHEEIEPHHEYILKLLTTITDDPDLAEDLTQETFERAWKKRSLMMHYENPKAALAEVAKNILRRHWKKRKCGPQTFSLDALPERELERVAAEDVADTFLREESRLYLMSILNELRRDHKRVLILHDYYGLSLKEIADLLGVNYNTVSAWHQRALKNAQKIHKSRKGGDAYE